MPVTPLSVPAYMLVGYSYSRNIADCAASPMECRRGLRALCDHCRMARIIYICGHAHPVEQGLVVWGQTRREVGGVRLNADQWGQYRALTGQIGRLSIGDLLATLELHGGRDPK